VTRWLSADEQRHWRAWLTMNRLLPEALDRDLRAEFEIGLGEYEILVQLSESAQGRVRMADLAHATLASRSKLTHQISRMEQAGWVTRERCAEDQRGQWAVLTDEGWALIRRAAPVHVESVRRRLLDVLGEEDFSALGRLCAIAAAPLTDSMPGISAPLVVE
jgi:DNA-binding MarR family transcriptional regulator